MFPFFILELQLKYLLCSTTSMQDTSEMTRVQIRQFYHTNMLKVMFISIVRIEIPKDSKVKYF